MDDTYSIMIRMDAATAAALRKLARQERRSINAQVVTLIERAVEQNKARGEPQTTDAEDLPY